jgi:hypothetical protein
MFLIYALGVVFYFIPAGVAGMRDHHNSIAIFVLNLLLGWTFVGWVIALVWACTEVRGYSAPNRGAAPPAWSAEHDEIEWSARSRGERTRSRW